MISIYNILFPYQYFNLNVSIYVYPIPSMISKYVNNYYHIYADDIEQYVLLTNNSQLTLNHYLSNYANNIK